MTTNVGKNGPLTKILIVVAAALLASGLGLVGHKAINAQSAADVSKQIANEADQAPVIQELKDNIEDIREDVTDIRIQQGKDSGKLDMILQQLEDND